MFRRFITAIRTRCSSSPLPPAVDHPIMQIFARTDVHLDRAFQMAREIRHDLNPDPSGNDLRDMVVGTRSKGRDE